MMPQTAMPSGEQRRADRAFDEGRGDVHRAAFLRDALAHFARVLFPSPARGRGQGEGKLATCPHSLANARDAALQRDRCRTSPLVLRPQSPA